MAFPPAPRTPELAMLSATEVCRLAGLTYRELDYWTRRGVLLPEPRPAQTGYPRRFSERETRVVQLCATLRSHGVGLDPLARVAAQARAWADAEWTGHVFIDRDGGVHRDPRPAALWFDLGVLVDDRVPA